MEQPIVPVYLNQKMVFDLVAMLRGGLSTVTAVTTNSAHSQESTGNVSAGFGVSDALSSLLKVNLSAGKSRGNMTSAGSTATEERVHTPASLFYELRDMLRENQFLEQHSTGQIPDAGNFVEFAGFLKRNPIVETLDSFAEMLSLADVFSDQSQQKGKGGGKGRKSEEQKIRDQMLSLSNSLKAGNTIDLTATVDDGSFASVVTVETKFLNDPAMSDLVDGQFKVLGKVTRSISDPQQSISLLRKTALQKMPSGVLDQFFEAFNELESEQGFSVPNMLSEIPGPAVQVLPVAIYA